MKQYYAYIRVSTTKQGEKGASLNAQREAIQRYAAQHGLSIAAWFEEQETAAKRGRQLFNQMLAGLARAKAHGVIIHKIDRGARNLRDWSDLGELIDRGIEVHFAHESLDLTSRGGRLSADIQAVVAADFIRNLRQEIRKGIYGRLREGLYPWPAPHGYRNAGGGKPKEIDPIVGPQVLRAFELYATGKYNLEMIAAELGDSGFTLNTGSPPSLNTVSLMLNNPFYMGVIHVRTTGETFPGIHQPLVPPSLFERVQRVLTGRTKNQGLKHEFLYRKEVHCATCSRVLIPERQKGHVYYRCQAKTCKGSCIREELLESEVDGALARISIDQDEIEDFSEALQNFLASEPEVRAQEVQTRAMRLENIEARMTRLTDAYIDRLIEKVAYEERNAALLRERATLKEELSNVEAGRGGIAVKLKTALELMKSLQNKGALANSAEKLELLKSASSNLSLERKSLTVTWTFPADVLAERALSLAGAPRRSTSRTCVMHGMFLLNHNPGSLLCKMLKQLEEGSDSKQRPQVSMSIQPPSPIETLQPRR